MVTSDPSLATVDDGGDAPGVIPFEAHRMARDGGDAAKVDPGRTQAVGRTSRDDPGQTAPLAHGLDLRGARRDDDLVRVDVEHPARLAGDDRRAWIDPDDVDAVARVEHDGVASLRRLAPAGTAPDDRDAGMDAANAHGLADREPGEVAQVHVRQWRLASCRVPLDDGPGACCDLARPDVGRPVNLGEAVAAVAGQAERATPARHLPRPDDRDGDGVAGLARRSRRPSTTIRPAIPAASAPSVTGASADPADRTTARAGGAPAAGCR